MRPGRAYEPRRRRGKGVNVDQPTECGRCLDPIPAGAPTRVYKGQVVHPTCAPGGDDG